MNRDPDSFWASEINNGKPGLEVVFEKTVEITKIVIGARKSREDWNKARYFNVKAFIDQKFVTATGTDPIPEDWKIQFDFAPTMGRRVELIWWYQYAQVANIFIHYKKVGPGSNSDSVTYHMLEDLKTWEEAQGYCQEKGWELAAPRSGGEAEALAKSVGEAGVTFGYESWGGYWVGFRKTNGKWAKFLIKVINYQEIVNR